MSHYEDEVDYSVDPLEGVDIWGLGSHGDMVGESDLDPAPGGALPTLPELSNVE